MSKQKFLNASAMAALCALAAFTLQAKAQDQAQPANSQSQEGMVVVRDAQTGKMRAPTPDELKALRTPSPAAAAGAAAAAPNARGRQQAPQVLSPRRDGTRGVRLGDKTMVYEVVTRGADGKLDGECVQGHDAAEAILHGAAAAHAAHGATDQHKDNKEHAHETR